MTSTEKALANKERILVSAYRSLHPRSRAETIIRFCQNGPAVRQRECILCGEKSPTWASKWPRTVESIAWELSHRKRHGV